MFLSCPPHSLAHSLTHLHSSPTSCVFQPSLIPRPFPVSWFQSISSLLHTPFLAHTVNSHNTRQGGPKQSYFLAYTLPSLLIPHVPMRRRRGVIVTISSVAADLPPQLNSVYSATKVIPSCTGQQLYSQEMFGMFPSNSSVNGNVPQNKSTQIIWDPAGIQPPNSSDY